MRTIDADAFKKYIDAQEGRPFIGCTVGEAMKILIDEQPTIQPEKAQLSKESTTSDTISRQAAIDAIVQCTNCGDEDTLREYVLKHSLDNGWTGGILEALDAVKDLPSAQPEVLACGNGELVVKPEPAIPLSWVEKYIEWLKSFDNEFANLAAAHISVMLKKWRDEPNE